MQEKRNYIANALELRLRYTHMQIYAKWMNDKLLKLNDDQTRQHVTILEKY